MAERASPGKKSFSPLALAATSHKCRSRGAANGLDARRGDGFPLNCMKTYCKDGKPSEGEADNPIVQAAGESL